MERINVSSSNLKSVGYDKAKSQLEIEFNSGGIYVYYNVPENIFDDLMEASSKGKYFHKFINEVFGYTKIK